MSENTETRRKLEEIYGPGCMFKKAQIEKKIEKLKYIKTYKKYKKEIHYTRSKIKNYESEMNYHHLVHKAEGRRSEFRKWCSCEQISSSIYAQLTEKARRSYK